jgi:hypothetical protein
MTAILPLHWDRTRPLHLNDIRGWPAISYLRFSSSLQRDGDSIERQRINTGRAIRALHLVHDRALEERAKSASKGHHRTRGELGRLLDAITAGHVPPGTVLIVEAVDRLTREGPLDAYPMLQTIIRAGIVLLVCGEAEDHDEFDLYDEHAINDGKGDKLHTQIRSAFNYTKGIAKRAKAKHARRREQAARGEDVVPNGRPPFWIDRHLTARKRGEPVHKLNERHSLILAIFDAAMRHNSLTKITAVLSASGLMAPDGAPWRRSAIGRILRDDAVIGYWTPTQIIGGKRTPVGAPHKVYPEAIPLAQWQAVQDRLDATEGVLRGATGKSVPNLFTGRTACATCGGPLRIDTGGGIRRGQRKRHLLCASYVERQGCGDRSRYDMAALEQPLVMTLLERLRLAPQAPALPSSHADRRAELELRIRNNDEAITTMMPRVSRSSTLLAHVERLGEETDALREELRAVIEVDAMEASRQRQDQRTWRLLKETLQPALAGDVEARERLRMLLAGKDYRIVGGGGGRLWVKVGAVSEPVPSFSMTDADEEDESLLAMAALA